MPGHRLPDPLTVRPVADPQAVVRGEKYRISVLTDGLLRLEYADDGTFEDRASAFALHRELPVPDFTVRDGGHALEIVTNRLHLVYDRGPFSTSGLSVQVRGGVSSWHSVWRYGESARDGSVEIPGYHDYGRHLLAVQQARGAGPVGGDEGPALRDLDALVDVHAWIASAYDPLGSRRSEIHPRTSRNQRHEYYGDYLQRRAHETSPVSRVQNAYTR